MDALYTVGDNNTHYKTESANLLRLMNSAAKLFFRSCDLQETTVAGNKMDRDSMETRHFTGVLTRVGLSM